MHKLYTTPASARRRTTPSETAILPPGAAQLRWSASIKSPLVFITGHGLVDMHDAGPSAASSRIITTIALDQLKSGALPDSAE